MDTHTSDHACIFSNISCSQSGDKSVKCFFFFFSWPMIRLLFIIQQLEKERTDNLSIDREREAIEKERGREEERRMVEEKSRTQRDIKDIQQNRCELHQLWISLYPGQKCVCVCLTERQSDRKWERIRSPRWWETGKETKREGEVADTSCGFSKCHILVFPGSVCLRAHCCQSLRRLYVELCSMDRSAFIVKLPNTSLWERGNIQLSTKSLIYFFQSLNMPYNVLKLSRSTNKFGFTVFHIFECLVKG